MDYDSELERVLSTFQTVPRKLSEANVRMIGALNHFETFEDELTDSEAPTHTVIGKRLSLSGSIVVLDLDFVKPGDVLAVSVSLSRETASESSWSAMAPTNDPSGHLLKSLRKPRLDTFARMLSFLSRCDRFSTKDIDCFKALDLVSESIYLYLNHNQTREFGVPVMNPPNLIGLGLKYWETRTTEYFAMIDIIPGSRRKFSLKKINSVDGYLDTTNYTWKPSAEPTAIDSDARAELVLTLDPPITISETLAAELNAVVGNESPEIDKRLHNSSFSIPKHPRLANSTCGEDYDVRVGVMLPYKLVEVKQIPITGPAQIPRVLSQIKPFAMASKLVSSLIVPGSEIPWTQEATDLNIGDALALQDQPVHRPRVPITASWRLNNSSQEIVISWVLSELQLIIELNTEIKLRVVPHSMRLNMNDMQKLVEKGELNLAISYALCSIGQLQRRPSSFRK